MRARARLGGHAPVADEIQASRETQRTREELPACRVSSQSHTDVRILFALLVLVELRDYSQSRENYTGKQA